MKKGLLYLFILFFWSCAQVSPPTGGIIDSTPPALVNSTPPQNTVYFSADGFDLEFDEMVDLDNIYGQLLVSPPMKEKPVVRVNKKKIHVHFDKNDLQENSTYTFNFGSAIKDHNEGNVLPNFTYVFSTGSYIDSLSLSGTVNDAFSEEAVKSTLVLMYRNLEDSMPLTSMPNYFGISDENGNYRINNIKEGKYKLFALEDFNQNYIYDQPSERIAFLNDFIQLDSNIEALDFNLFSEASNKQFVSERDVQDFGRLHYTFNKGLKELDLTLKDAAFDDSEYKVKLSKSKDTLDIWFPDYDGKFLMIIKEDSSFIDTSEIDIKPVFTIEEMPPFNITPNFSGQMDLNKTLSISFDNPITEWNPEFISLHEDSIKMDIQPYFSDSLRLTLIIPYQWKEKRKYLLLVGLGSFTDFYNQTNELFELRFGAQEESYYGKVNIDMDFGEAVTPFIIQMLDAEGKVINERTLEKSGIINYTYLSPEEYGFRLIQDLNKNGKWDTGEYSSKTQPEPVLYYPSKTKVRSNWEIDLSWLVKLNEEEEEQTE